MLTPTTPRVTQPDIGYGEDVAQLNSFLRGEISAVETYDQALLAVQGGEERATLQSCRESHIRRVELLRAEIRRLGGTPAASSGLWGSLAKLVEGGASILGENAALAALVEGEEHGLKDYLRDVYVLSAPTREFIRLRILPMQDETLEQMRRLREHRSSEAQTHLIAGGRGAPGQPRGW